MVPVELNEIDACWYPCSFLDTQGVEEAAGVPTCVDLIQFNRNLSPWQKMIKCPMSFPSVQAQSPKHSWP